MTETLRVGRHRIEITHPGKALFSDPPITKLELAHYYASVAPAMLPHLRDRPLALQAFPRGIAAPGYYLKAIPAHFPDWIARATVPKRGGSLTQIVARDAATLVYLASQNVISPHVWLSRTDALREPDRLIIDLDPAPGVGFDAVRAAARTTGDHLRAAGLRPFAMVTGSRGVHVVCPLRRGPSYQEVHGFARAVAEAMVADDPGRLTLEWHRAERGRRIYLDVNRINYAQHAIAPYGVRPRAGAPVAMPIAWEELSDARLRPDGWSIGTALARVQREGDAWGALGRHARRLPASTGR
jgi:bifunctional non-homologous end joining protein LigD